MAENEGSRSRSVNRRQFLKKLGVGAVTVGATAALGGGLAYFFKDMGELTHKETSPQSTEGYRIELSQRSAADFDPHEASYDVEGGSELTVTWRNPTTREIKQLPTGIKIVPRGEQGSEIPAFLVDTPSGAVEWLPLDTRQSPDPLATPVIAIIHKNDTTKRTDTMLVQYQLDSEGKQTFKLQPVKHRSSGGPVAPPRIR